MKSGKDGLTNYQKKIISLKFHIYEAIKELEKILVNPINHLK